MSSSLVLVLALTMIAGVADAQAVQREIVKEVACREGGVCTAPRLSYRVGHVESLIGSRFLSLPEDRDLFVIEVCNADRIETGELPPG